jgi:hypothetical protein
MCHPATRLVWWSSHLLPERHPNMCAFCHNSVVHMPHTGCGVDSVMFVCRVLQEQHAAGNQLRYQLHYTLTCT